MLLLVRFSNGGSSQYYVFFHPDASKESIPTVILLTQKPDYFMIRKNGEIIGQYSPVHWREKMRHAGSAFLGILFGFAMLFTPFYGICSNQPKPYPDVTRMSPGQCIKQLQNVPPPIVIDVRLQEQFKESLQKIPGAVHEDPGNVKSWAHKYKKDSHIILY
jgi:hypothetical protein